MEYPRWVGDPVPSSELEELDTGSLSELRTEEFATTRVPPPPSPLQRVGAPMPTGLPLDIERQAARRIERLAWVGVAFFGVALALLLLQPGAAPAGGRRWPFALAGTLGALAFAVLVGREGLAPATRVRAGLGFHVVMAWLLALIELPRYFGDPHLTGISALTVWQLLFPGLVPMRTRDVVGGAILVAAAAPVTGALAAATGSDIDLGAVALSSITVVAAGGVGIAFSRILYALGREVAAARHVGSYQLLEVLGRGAMGEVWRAEHRLLRRPAAVKLILASRLAKDAQLTADQFQREARITATLRSPHTIELYDFGVTDDGVFFYVMELLEGGDLQSILDAHGPLPPGRVIHLLRQACLSLDEAHAAGLVHRDIKPANLFVARLGTSYDVLKVLDFGVAEGVGAEPERNEGGVVVRGNAATVAPEALQGRSTDGRADLYALGHVGLILLTGKHVFDAPTRDSLVDAHLRCEPVRPSRRAGVTIPADLEDLLMHCIAKDPEERPPSAAALERALASCIDAHGWTTDDAMRWWAARKPSPPRGEDP